MAEFKSDLSDTELDDVQPVPIPQITVESLLQHIKSLTNNQNELIGQIRHLKAKAEDPFLQFRTPDPIKNLATFAGNKKETHAWLEDAENTLDLFKSYQDEPVYSQLVRAVKNKITGEAKETLIAAGNPNGWAEIKEVILNSYGDRRDLTSHIQSLFYITQGKKTLTEYYNKIKTIDTAIKSTAAMMEDYVNSTKAINSLVSLITLTRFIDGLTDDLPMHVRSYRPKSLEEAYTITTQYANAAYRQKFNKRPPSDHINKNVRQTNSNFNNPNVPLVNISKPPTNFNNNSNQFIAKPSTSNFNNPHTKSYGSGKFKTRATPPDDDVSMRTARSHTEVNNHETERKNCEDEFDTSQQQDENVLNSDDDDYFVDEELNFHVEEAPQRKKKNDNNFVPYITIQTSKGEMKFLIDTGANKNYISPAHVNIENCLYRSTNNVAFIAVQNHSETSIEINANELKLSNDLDKEIENDPFDLMDLPKTVDPAKYTFRDDHMNDEEKHALKKVINNYRDVLYVETDKLSFTHKIKHNVRTVDNVPVHSKSYKYPYVYESEVQDQIKKMLADGIIKESISPYTSPVWVVPKKPDASGKKKFRLVIDYRKLNEKTINDKYPIPEITDILDKLGKAKYFSTIDLVSGFHQIQLAKEDTEKTAFSVNGGKYEFTPAGRRPETSEDILQYPRRVKTSYRTNIGELKLGELSQEREEKGLWGTTSVDGQGVRNNTPENRPPRRIPVQEVSKFSVKATHYNKQLLGAMKISQRHQPGK
ncbi:uncharacterized protein LOC128735958 [Sabethes cyaneus]|uniref:uncharacterized protein LOC128735958 n=1 Tax=Sabethes cyaneus TaxID=53552 RepID=UPI00237EABF9|nr:uncharacterized protein LOC128735958 [Sabethes cyaneus]